MGQTNGGVRFDVFGNGDHDDHLFPATRANDLDLMGRRRPGGQVVGPGASEYNNMAEIENMLSYDPDADDDDDGGYWFNSEY